MRQVVKIGTTVAAALVALSAPALAYVGSNASGQPMIAQSVPAFLQDIVPLEVIGLTDDQRLVRFNTIVPGLPLNGPRVSGLQGDATVIGIDYRVQNNLLYGVGNAGGIYTLNPGNGNATKVSQLSVPLAGTSFGVDFNPAANRLRVISDTGQNLRHNIDDPSGMPVAGTTAVDAALTTPPTAGPTTGVTAAGYTNNDLAATTGTTLFDVSTANDTLVVQSPANAGTLAMTGQLTVNAAANAGFDVYSTLRNGTTVGNRALATLQVNGSYALYEVNLLTGEAISRGAFGFGNSVVDIAIPLNQS
ncbi:MAG: DUF4394 domain-containing protein [Pseudonocardiaceae bacterium]